MTNTDTVWKPTKDVFGPSDTDQKLPVYVWIHGGSFTKVNVKHI